MCVLSILSLLVCISTVSCLANEGSWSGSEQTVKETVEETVKETVKETLSLAPAHNSKAEGFYGPLISFGPFRFCFFLDLASAAAAANAFAAVSFRCS